MLFCEKKQPSNRAFWLDYIDVLNKSFSVCKYNIIHLDYTWDLGLNPIPHH